MAQVAKQWFDYDRSTYKFIREVKEGGSLKFTQTSDFDENGIIYWIGTNGKCVTLYITRFIMFLVSEVITDYSTQLVSFGKTIPIGRPFT